MELNELFAKNIEIRHEGKTYTFRPSTVEDSIWMQQEFGKDAEDLFSLDNADMLAYTRLAYRLYSGDKSQYRPKEIEVENEDGTTEVVTIGGYKLFGKDFKGTMGTIALVTAVNSAYASGMPEVSEVSSSVDEDKKKEQDGKKSLTSSVQNMGGRANI